MTPPAVAVYASAPAFHPVRPIVERSTAIHAAGVALAQSVAKGRQIDASVLRAAMERAFGASDASGAWVWKDAYEAVEAAQILFLRQFGPSISRVAKSPASMLALLEKIGSLLPTETRRSETSMALQQFSTPIELAYVAARATGIRPGDFVLEPSAGTGMLAIHAEVAGADLALNEWAEDHHGLLRALFPARDLSMQLADRVEAVCRHYLSNGRRSGGYWIVGDTGNAKGRSLFVRLTGPATGKGARGRWQDSATDQFGDLLDLIAAREGYRSLSETLAEARRFLGMPERVHDDGYARDQHQKPRTDTSFIARRIWSEGLPLAGTVAEAYLRARCLLPPYPADLRFHPSLEYRDYQTGEITTHPALLAAVKDASGTLKGIQRTWLAPGGGKARLADPRRSLGHLHGNGVWLRHGGTCRQDGPEQQCGALLIGEGVETVLSLRDAIPAGALVAALSASHLAAFILPSWVRHLVIIKDNDPAGIRAAWKLAERAAVAGISVTILRPVLKDFNADLRLLGRSVLTATIQRQCPAFFAA